MLNTHKSKSDSRLKRATLMIAAICATSVSVGSAVTLLAQPAYAASETNVRTKIVRYGDLDLASEQGRDELSQRIRRAAKRVCTPDGIPAVSVRRQIRACTEAAHNVAWADAQHKVRNLRLALRTAD